MNMKWKEFFERLLGRRSSHREAKEKRPYVPVSQRVCPLCGKIIGFDVSFLSIGDETYHLACIDKFEQRERGELE